MSLVFAYDRRPSKAELSAIVAAALPGAPLEDKGGLVLEELVAETTVAGLPLRVRMTTENTNKQGYRPYTAVELLWDPGAPMYLGGARWAYTDFEHAVAFAHPGAADRRWVGVPAHLVYRIVAGPLGARIAAVNASRHGEVMELAVSEPAQRRRPGVGMVLQCRGWPADAATLRFLVDTLVELAETVRASLPAGASSFDATPEVATYRKARAESRERGLMLVAAVMGGLSVVSLLLFVLAFTLVR